MKVPIRILITTIILAGFVSCTLYRTIPIEVLQSQEVRLDTLSPKVAFIYRNFKFNNDTLQNYYLQDGQLVRVNRYGTGINTDSVVATRCLENVAGKLRENKVSAAPVIFPADLFPRQSGERIHPLQTDLVKKLAKPAQADYIIFLETLSYFFSHFNGENVNDEYQEVRIAGIWAVHEVSTGKIIDKKTMTDTLYWNNSDGRQNQEGEKFPPRLVALQQAAELFGENYAKRFYPGWVTVDRLLIIPPLEDFRLAGEWVEKQQWNQAEGIWSRYADQRFGRLSVSACYNLALANEIRDELDGAITWAEKAAEIARIYNNRDEVELTRQYKDILIKRFREIKSTERENNP